MKIHTKREAERNLFLFEQSICGLKINLPDSELGKLIIIKFPSWQIRLTRYSYRQSIFFSSEWSKLEEEEPDTLVGT
jgi:hypothetical protein